MRVRVLVCGGRDYSGRENVYKVLDELSPACVIHGGASGADSLANEWATDRKVEREVYYADWTKLGRAAGPMRNSLMLKEGKPDLVVAFPGGKGTLDMKRKAAAAGLQVIEVLA